MIVYHQIRVPIVKDRDYTVRLTRYADPAGRLPHWIVNMLAPKASADLLEKLIDEADRRS